MMWRGIVILTVLIMAFIMECKGDARGTVLMVVELLMLITVIVFIVIMLIGMPVY